MTESVNSCFTNYINHLYYCIVDIFLHIYRPCLFWATRFSHAYPFPYPRSPLRIINVGMWNNDMKNRFQVTDHLDKYLLYERLCKLQRMYGDFDCIQQNHTFSVILIILWINTVQFIQTFWNLGCLSFESVRFLIRAIFLCLVPSQSPVQPWHG